MIGNWCGDWRGFLCRFPWRLHVLGSLVCMVTHGSYDSIQMCPPPFLSLSLFKNGFTCWDILVWVALAYDCCILPIISVLGGEVAEWTSLVSCDRFSAAPVGMRAGPLVSRCDGGAWHPASPSVLSSHWAVRWLPRWQDRDSSCLPLIKAWW